MMMKLLQRLGHSQIQTTLRSAKISNASVDAKLRAPIRPWAAWNAAVNATPMITALRGKRDGISDTATFAAYLLDLPEIFARAFAQWVIYECGTLVERAALDDRALKFNGVLIQQWLESEFVTPVPHPKALHDPDSLAERSPASARNPRGGAE